MRYTTLTFTFFLSFFCVCLLRTRPKPAFLFRLLSDGSKGVKLPKWRAIKTQKIHHEHFSRNMEYGIDIDFLSSFFSCVPLTRPKAVYLCCLLSDGSKRVKLPKWRAKQHTQKHHPIRYLLFSFFFFFVSTAHTPKSYAPFPPPQRW